MIKLWEGFTILQKGKDRRGNVAIGLKLPSIWFKLPVVGNDLEMSSDGGCYLRIWDYGDIIVRQKNCTHTSMLDKYVPIGDNGGELLICLSGNDNSIHGIEYGSIGLLDELVVIAPSLDALLLNGEGTTVIGEH
jgi:hypothetical protein